MSCVGVTALYINMIRMNIKQVRRDGGVNQSGCSNAAAIALARARVCLSSGPAAVVKTGPGTEQPQRHTEIYCPYNDASVTP